MATPPVFCTKPAALRANVFSVPRLQQGRLDSFLSCTVPSQQCELDFFTRQHTEVSFVGYTGGE